METDRYQELAREIGNALDLTNKQEAIVAALLRERLQPLVEAAKPIADWANDPKAKYVCREFCQLAEAVKGWLPPAPHKEG